jgi:hypothetical protein
MARATNRWPLKLKGVSGCAVREKKQQSATV